jgi:hypothetical protein
VHADEKLTAFLELEAAIWVKTSSLLEQGDESQSPLNGVTSKDRMPPGDVLHQN